MNIFPGPLKKEMNQTDPLDEILDGLTKNIMANRKADNPPQGRQMLLAEAEAAINAEIAKAVHEIIGEDEPIDNNSIDSCIFSRNQLRARQRAKLKERLPHEI